MDATLITPLREKNLKLLSSMGFSVADSLPVYPQSLRPSSEILARFFAMEAVFRWVAHGVEPDNKIIDRLQNWLTDLEKDMLAMPKDMANENFAFNIGWKLENMWSLAWALGFDRSPSVDGDFITAETTKEMLGSFLVNYSSRKPRTEEEVIEMEDLFYCAHNAVVSAQAFGQDTVPEGFDPVLNGGVIIERRQGLSFCLTDKTWDEVDMST